MIAAITEAISPPISALLNPQHLPPLFSLPLSMSLRSKLPSWARAVVPKIFYVTEKAWNYYPYTITGELIE